MSRRLQEHRRQLAHETEAHRRVIESIATVPGENVHTPAYHRALDRFDHVLVARDVWLCRLRKGEEGCPAAPSTFFPEGATPESIAEHAASVEKAWDRYLGTLDEADLDRVVEYQSSDGAAWKNTIGEVLTHVYTHGFYHRGQVATLIAQSGGTPALQDFILFAREG